VLKLLLNQLAKDVQIEAVLQRQRLGHARSVVPGYCDWRQIIKFVSGQEPIMASLAAYCVPKDLGPSSATSQPKVRSLEFVQAEPPATGMLKGAEPTRE